ncbi:hypothetical protein Droror1_Dr00000279 [Drosera rotundifolia]
MSLAQETDHPMHEDEETTTMSTTTASQNKKRKNIESRSKIWDHFSKKMVKVGDDDTIVEKKMAACNYYAKEIGCGSDQEWNKRPQQSFEIM